MILRDDRRAAVDIGKRRPNEIERESERNSDDENGVDARPTVEHVICEVILARRSFAKSGEGHEVSAQNKEHHHSGMRVLSSVVVKRKWFRRAGATDKIRVG